MRGPGTCGGTADEGGGTKAMDRPPRAHRKSTSAWQVDCGGAVRGAVVSRRREKIWYAFWPRWPSRLHCSRGLRPRLRPGFAARPVSARAAGRAACPWSMPRFGRCAGASATARCRSARSCGVGPEAEAARPAAMAEPGPTPGVFHFENAASISALTPTSASGVSTSTSAALRSSGTSMTASL